MIVAQPTWLLLRGQIGWGHPSPAFPTPQPIRGQIGLPLPSPARRSANIPRLSLYISFLASSRGGVAI